MDKDEEIICPECRYNLTRKYGLPAVVYTCLKCNKDYIQRNFDKKMLPREEFMESEKEFNG
jgi:DNA-directed RNA polymerase subunit RPC12/RpoP